MQFVATDLVPLWQTQAYDNIPML